MIYATHTLRLFVQFDSRKVLKALDRLIFRNWSQFAQLLCLGRYRSIKNVTSDFVCTPFKQTPGIFNSMLYTNEYFQKNYVFYATWLRSFIANIILAVTGRHQRNHVVKNLLTIISKLHHFLLSR